MTNVVDVVRAREVKAAIANMNLEALINQIEVRAKQAITGLQITDLQNDEFVCSVDGVQVRISSPEFVKDAQAIVQQRRDAQRSLPTQSNTEGKTKPGRPFSVGKVHTRASVHPIASINASAGQTRRRAIDKGQLQEGDPLPEDLINRIVVRNSLRDSAGNIPAAIQEKLRFGVQLDMNDLQKLVPQGAVKASVCDDHAAN